MTAKTEPASPWVKYYGNIPPHLEFKEQSLSEAILESCARENDFPALEFMGNHISYSSLAEKIDTVAKAFHNLGVRPGMRVVICLPNVPQAVFCLYGLNRIGAVAAMVHPLSAPGEIRHYIKETSCSVAVTLDQFYPNFEDVIQDGSLDRIIIARVSSFLPFPSSLIYKFSQEHGFPKVKYGPHVIRWKDFISGADGVTELPAHTKDPHKEAVVLFSGGTTGTSKGIMLSGYGFNAVARQLSTFQDDIRHSTMLAAMPIFHGFGLGVCIHTMLYSGATAILVPRFNEKSYARLIKRYRPNLIAGVPTLFDSLTNCVQLNGVDLSCLRGVFSGGDSLSIEMKKKIDDFLAAHGAGVRVREGFGATECTTACCLTPRDREKAGSIGIPFPDNYISICKVGTTETVPYGEDGEICVCGPSVMIGYMNHDEETARALQVHPDGNTWLHTGDMGMMDEDGFVYFRQRIKRMIITSGYNVYPSQLENIIESHPAVKTACVIGVSDPHKIQKVKAFVVLEDDFRDNAETRRSIMAHCRNNIARYAIPRELEIRDSLPMTSVGKVAYTKLS